MSDINLHFNAFELALIALVIGRPGALIGCLFGAVAIRQRRIIGAMAGALLGDICWATGTLYLY